MSEALKPGDVVVLNSESPLMTIDSYNKDFDKFECTWFDKEGKRQVGKFNPKSLRKATPEDKESKIKFAF